MAGTDDLEEAQQIIQNTRRGTYQRPRSPVASGVVMKNMPKAPESQAPPGYALDAPEDPTIRKATKELFGLAPGPGGD